LFGLVTNHACDRRADRQNYDSKDRASIAVSRGKMGVVLISYGVKVNAQYCWDSLVYQRMLDTINAYDDNLAFEQGNAGYLAFNTVQLRHAVQNSELPFS